MCEKDLTGVFNSCTAFLLCRFRPISYATFTAYSAFVGFSDINYVIV